MADISIALTGLSATASVGTVTAKVKRNLAVQHLQGAARFSHVVGQVEASIAAQGFGSSFDEIIWHSNACVLLSVAALEAYANETFLDPQNCFPEVSPDYVGSVWPTIEGAPVLDKFQIALTMRSRQLMDKGAAPFQNARLLIALRNAITHFKPEWHTDNAEHKKLSEKLESALDQSNQFFPNEHLFPVRWMKHSNTGWAVQSAVTFMQAFETASGYQPKMDYSALSY